MSAGGTLSQYTWASLQQGVAFRTDSERETDSRVTFGYAAASTILPTGIFVALHFIRRNLHGAGNWPASDRKHEMKSRATSEPKSIRRNLHGPDTGRCNLRSAGFHPASGEECETHFRVTLRPPRGVSKNAPYTRCAGEMRTSTARKSVLQQQLQTVKEP